MSDKMRRTLRTLIQSGAAAAFGTALLAILTAFDVIHLAAEQVAALGGFFGVLTTVAALLMNTVEEKTGVTVLVAKEPPPTE